MVKRKHNKNNGTPSDRIESEKEHSHLSFDFHEFGHFVEDSELTEEEQKELLEALWTILIQFIDMGFGSQSLQSKTDDEKVSQSKEERS